MLSIPKKTRQPHRVSTLHTPLMRDGTAIRGVHRPLTMADQYILFLLSFPKATERAADDTSVLRVCVTLVTIRSRWSKEHEGEVSVMKFLHTTHIPLSTGMWVECRPWNQSMGLNQKNSWHCFIFFYFGTEHRTPFGDNVVTTSGPKGFFLNFNIGIVHEILPGWQNFKSPVEIYHGHLKFCHIGRILKVLGYSMVQYHIRMSNKGRS